MVEKFNNLFPLPELYVLASNFLREKEGKAFHLKYHERLKLAGFANQIKYGAYKQANNAPDVGFFDVVGNDRKQAWVQCGDMTKEKAQEEFVVMLDSCCPLFMPYVVAHKRDEEEKEKMRQEEERKKAQQEEEERRRLAGEVLAKEQKQLAQAATQAEVQRRLQHEAQIHAILNQETYPQFKQYAQEHFPGDVAKQEDLIKQLQDRHFQQYMTQIYERQLLHQKRLCEQQEQKQLQQQQHQGIITTTGNNAQNFSLGNNINANSSHSGRSVNVNGTPVNSFILPSVTGSNNDTAGSNKIINGSATGGNSVSDPGASNLSSNINVTGDVDSVLPPLTAASMWTRKDVKEFRLSLSVDKESMLKIGPGECVTIRVPTHDEGTSVFWEFATDNYDIGFGLFFEWSSLLVADGGDKTALNLTDLVASLPVADNNSESTQTTKPQQDKLTVHVESPAPPVLGDNIPAVDTHKGNFPTENVSSVSSTTTTDISENMEQTNSADKETINANSTTTKTNINPPPQPPVQEAIIDEIIPIYRRDCSQEVYCGSHQYPGKGIYLLKFDNSYSMWRSKCLYYRVYYTK